MEFICNAHSEDELSAMKTRPLEVKRDPRLPVTLAEAEAFKKAVDAGGDFAAAAQAVEAVRRAQ